MILKFLRILLLLLLTYTLSYFTGIDDSVYVIWGLTIMIYLKVSDKESPPSRRQRIGIGFQFALSSLYTVVYIYLNSTGKW